MNEQFKTNIKMLVLDLDGTLLRSDKTISEYTISILEKCKQRGIAIVVATGRSEMAAKDFINKIIPDGFISNGGSLVLHGENIVHKCMLKAETSDKIIAELISKDEFVSARIETETGYYVSWEEVDPSDYINMIHHDFKIPIGKDTIKMVFELTNGDIAREIAAKYPDCSMIPFSDEEWYRFANKYSDKLDGLKEIIKLFSTDLSQIISFGDDFNDLEMIKQCGVGVAMANSIDEVKEVADYICDTNDNDGVAKWIEKYMLI